MKMSEIKATDLVIDEDKKIKKDVDSVSVKVVDDLEKRNREDVEKESR